MRKAGALSAVFLTLWAFQSCKKPEQVIGTEVQPEGDNIGFEQSDQFVLDTRVVPADSVRSDELSQSMVGVYRDMETGEFRAATGAHLRLSSSNVDFGDPNNLVVDSIILSLRYSGYYGDTAYPLNFQVKELDEDIFGDSVYYSNHTFLTKGENLVEDGFTMPAHKPNTPVVVGEDTLDSQLRIPLKKSLAEAIINQSGTGTLDNSDQFISFFKGVFLETDMMPAVGEGLVLYFNWLSVHSQVEMYYRDTVAQDTVVFPFLINTNSARVGSIQHDYNGSNVMAALPPNEPVSSDKLWIRSGGSLAADIEIPAIDSLRSLENVVINQAELVFTVIPGTDNDPYVPHSRMFLISEDEEGNVTVLPDQLQGESFFGGSYDEEKGEYRFRISRWLQQVVRGELPNTGLRLVAGSSGVSANRTILGGFDNPVAKPKLVLSITKF